MRKVALALALLFVADIAMDTFDASCALEESCHACLCQTPLLASPAVTSTRIDAPRPAFVVTALESFADRLIDKTLFRPPIVLA
jgi:hypothetical protein